MTATTSWRSAITRGQASRRDAPVFSHGSVSVRRRCPRRIQGLERPEPLAVPVAQWVLVTPPAVVAGAARRAMDHCFMFGCPVLVHPEEHKVRSEPPNDQVQRTGPPRVASMLA